MLVKLLDLPDNSADIERLRGKWITIRKVRTFETSVLRRFLLENFNEGWADEVTTVAAQQPTTCFIATCDRKIIGFAAYESTARGFFGPMGVKADVRNGGVGRALLLACLRSMREMGYIYAIIGGVGPQEFYSKCCGATLIPDSTPGLYVDMLE
ncbi:MAG: GNAT family N-acetyltransferase [Armatimonadota bacterium]|nr:GNAT family N-acetyltransferase [bacterium]